MAPLSLSLLAVGDKSLLFFPLPTSCTFFFPPLQLSVLIYIVPLALALLLSSSFPNWNSCYFCIFCIYGWERWEKGSTCAKNRQTCDFQFQGNEKKMKDLKHRRGEDGIDGKEMKVGITCKGRRRTMYECLAHFRHVLPMPPWNWSPDLSLFSQASFHTAIHHLLTTEGDRPKLPNTSCTVLHSPLSFLSHPTAPVYQHSNRCKTRKDCKWGKKGNSFNYTEERITNISAVRLLSVSAIKKCFCIIGDFLQASEHGRKTSEENSELFHLALRTN